jgi:hypothetical protein
MSNRISKAARKVISDEVLLSKLDEFTDEEIGQLCNYSRALHTTTDFDEEVERELEKLEARSNAVSILVRLSNFTRQHDR